MPELQRKRARVSDYCATAKALKSNLNAWDAFMHYLVNGECPIHSDHCKNLI